ncbi:MAG: SGNH/GDSL hydrolase family protein [Bdellovibrionota bacterium]
MSKQLTLKQKLFLIFIPTILVLVFLEISARAVYFQRQSGEDSFALSRYAKRGVSGVFRLLAKGKVSKHNFSEKDLYSTAGEKLIQHFKLKYEDHFKVLLAEIIKADAKLLVVYIPSGNYLKDSVRRDLTRRFFQELSAKYSVDYLDLTGDFLEYDPQDITLLPEGGHLSRFGNKLVARKIAKKIKKFQLHNSSVSYDKRPQLFGDLAPNLSEVWSYKPEMPYLVVTNNQGLRRRTELTFPKVKQRVLVLGDSFSFGPYLPEYHSYPYFLENILANAEVVNAGVPGYTIEDEAGLFRDRAKYLEPDIVLLQVLDNDLTDFFWFKRNEFDRERKVYEPTSIEVEFLNQK